MRKLTKPSHKRKAVTVFTVGGLICALGILITTLGILITVAHQGWCTVKEQCPTIILAEIILLLWAIAATVTLLITKLSRNF